ncbi:hypothetical protein D6T63_18620 [Arthrobacter cheniae]|uniref:Uncharacterized protein n=1 Tax=Arthrobacter cheniae TaxID=1258888 RepID=A0A3A5LWP9_9MICC|nr:hypothetical protein [Arthrobacter cheniae]RJT74406.1 hypothetical protein D6T63_18620 [Arthrobacter cheniae]
MIDDYRPKEFAQLQLIPQWQQCGNSPIKDRKIFHSLLHDEQTLLLNRRDHFVIGLFQAVTTSSD